MSAPIRVLGDRVLVQPDVNKNAPEQTDGGIFLAGSLAAAVTGEDPTTSIHRGTVVGVGTPTHPLKHEAEVLAEKLSSIPEHHWRDGDLWEIAEDGARMLHDLVRRVPCVSVGDDVIYSRDAGQEITIETETYVILHEHELLGVVAPEPNLTFTGATEIPLSHASDTDRYPIEEGFVNG